MNIDSCLRMGATIGLIDGPVNPKLEAETVSHLICGSPQFQEGLFTQASACFTFLVLLAATRTLAAGTLSGISTKAAGSPG